MMIPSFAVDVMCIKPFDVGRYVSVGRLCERHAAAYYESLNACT